MAQDYFKRGDFNAVCDICGFKFKGSQLRKRWDGFMCCQDDWEPRPKQEFIRGIKENQATSFSRPESTDVFIVTGDIDSYALNTRAINSFHLG